MQIRAAQGSDLLPVAALFDQYRQFYAQAADDSLARDFIGQRLAKADSLILVAEAADTGLLGFCQLYPSFCSVQAQPIYVLYDLFVASSARRAGAGRALLQAAHARASADGKARMDLTTAKDNLGAQALYTSLGWVRDDVFLAYQLPVQPVMNRPNPHA